MTCPFWMPLLNGSYVLQSPEKLDSKLDGMSPREISYWLGLVFAQNPVIQQALLEAGTYAPLDNALV